MYSNKAQIANLDIYHVYDDFKSIKPFGLHGLYKDISALCGPLIPVR